MEVIIKEKYTRTSLLLADSSYNGLFLRSSLYQSNSIPRIGAQSSSPDIIPSGTQPITDPQKTLRDNYEKDLGVALQALQANYIYMRAKNYASDRIADDTDGNRPRLFFTKASVLTYPSYWKEILGTSSGKPVSLAANAGEIGVINEPWLWKPENISNDHYCLIGILPSPGYNNEPPDTLQISDFAAWVAQNGGVAWRNVQVVNATSLVVTSVADYDQGTEAARVMITLICDYLPVGTKVSFSAGTSGPNPPIYLPETPVTVYPSFTTGIVCDIPSDYKTNITVNIVAPPGITNLDKAKVTIRASYADPAAKHLFHLGHSLDELGILTPEHAYGLIRRQTEQDGAKFAMNPGIEMYLDQLSSLRSKVGPTRSIIVGANSVVWQ